MDKIGCNHRLYLFAISYFYMINESTTLKLYITTDQTTNDEKFKMFI